MLEVGGGEAPRYHPNMDIRKLATVDVVHDMVQPWPFEASSFDLVYMSHSLEHVSHRNIMDVISSARRILKPEGQLIIRVPDLARLLKLPWSFSVKAIYGDQLEPWRTHLCGFWPEAIFEVLKDFEVVEIRETMYGAYPELTVEAEKP